jgi:hypothetical protein
LNPEIAARYGCARQSRSPEQLRQMCRVGGWIALVIDRRRPAPGCSASRLLRGCAR